MIEEEIVEPSEQTIPISTALRSVLPRPDLVFVCQMIIIYLVIGVSLFNLSWGTLDANEGKIWVALLSSCLGYMLPNPKLSAISKQVVGPQP